MKEDTKNSYKKRILKVMFHIQQNMDRDISLEELASVAHFSPYHFHRVFKGVTGEGLAEHIRRLRLERAASRLIQTRHSITDLAFEAAYENVESFTRAFRERFGLSPSAYRRLGQGTRDFGENGWNGRPPSIPEYLGGKTMDVTIKKLGPRKVAFVRHTGPYEKCSWAWEKLCSWAGPRRLLGPKTTFLGLSYDDPDITPADKIRYDACIVVRDDVGPEGEIGLQEIPEGDFACHLHKGPLNTLAATYAGLCGQWLPSSGRELKNAPSIEVYLNDPERTPQEEILVEIQLPLEP